MKNLDIEALNERAARCYAKGQYEDARGAWEAVLASEPADRQAAEGLRMVGALSGEKELDGPLEREIVAVEELLLAGREAEGVQAAETLALAHPESAEIAWLALSARARFEAGPFVDEAMDSARRAWKRGDLAVARGACARILAVDPDHCAAREVMMHADEEALPVEAAPSRDMRRTAVLEEPAVASGLRPAAESASDSLFDPPGASDVVPLGSPDSPWNRQGASAPTDAMPLSHAAETTFGEEVEPSAFSDENKFAELEEELDESMSEDAPRGAMSDVPTHPPEDVSAAGAATQDALSDDLAFGEASWSPDQTPSETGSGSFEAAWPAAEGSGDPRIAELLREARGAIEAGRFSEAIETASRAFAIDAEAPGAQEVIDMARARLDEVDRQAEEHLYHAHKFLEEGDDTAAEALLREVLRTHPGHREATDLLARISRHKIGADVVAVPLARPAPEPPRAAPRPSLVDAPVPLRTDSSLPGSEAARNRAPEPVDSSAIPPIERTQRNSVRSGPSFYRFVFYAIVVVLLLGAAALGLRFLPRFFIGPETPAPAPTTKHPTRPGANASTQAPSPAKAEPEDPAAGLPRTIDAARALVGEGKWKEARIVLSDLVAQEPANRQAIEMLNNVESKIKEREQTEEALASIRAAFKQDRYEDSLRMLYRLPPVLQKGEVQVYMRNAWYNNGLLYMLGGNSVDAIRCFKEALDLDPGDQGAKQQMAYLKAYEGREKDGVYFRHVETLPRRSIDAR